MPIPRGGVGTTPTLDTAGPVSAHKMFSCQEGHAYVTANALVPGSLFPSVMTGLPFVAAPTLSQPGCCIGHAPHPTVHPALAMFTHFVITRANAVKFAHQSLCNLKNFPLLKTTRCGFLKGCPGISKKLILKYLNPSPAMAKGHMKRPRHGIKSTHPWPPRNMPTVPQPIPQMVVPIPLLGHEMHAYPGPAYEARQDPNRIVMDDVAQPRPNLIMTDEADITIANIFCFGAFVDKMSGIVYHDLTGSFPFISLDGSVCFFILYHYELNCILATPISGLDNKTIFEAFKKYFDELPAKGFKPKLNIMDNQATKHIKQFLSENACKLQLVKPHNHRVNAAEHAIQTFKDTFIAALATTDVDFPLQLWDKLTLQVQNCLNLMRCSQIDPSKSRYKTMNGPYDWN